MKIQGTFATFAGLVAGYFLIKMVNEQEQQDTTDLPGFHEAFQRWRNKFNKVYSSPAELEYRFMNFKENYLHVKKVNNFYAAGDSTWFAGLNKFSDLSYNDFKASYLNQGISLSNFKEEKTEDKGHEFRAQEMVGDPAPSIDWRTSGKLLPIADQLYCISGYAFSALDAISTAVAIKNNTTPLALSPQQIVDCGKSSGTSGCNGGLQDGAYKWIMKNGGVTSLLNYPYIARDNNCQSKPSIQKISSYRVNPGQNATAIINQLQNGIIPANIGTSRDIMNYSGGIFNGQCGTDLGQSVTIVGYGTENGQDYWIVRNSWGTFWGESGYIRLPKGAGTPQEGTCGILMYTLNLSV